MLKQLGDLPIVTLDALAKDQGWLSYEGKGVKIALMYVCVCLVHRIGRGGHHLDLAYRD